MKYVSFIVFALIAFHDIACAKDFVSRLMDSPASIKKWKNNKVVKFLPSGGFKNKKGIMISSKDAKKSSLCEYPLDIRKARGKLLSFTANVKAVKVSKPMKNYYGIKLMVIVTKADGSKTYLEEVADGDRFGTYNWVLLETIVKIPADAKSASLAMGIQQASGTVYFSDIKLEVIE